MKRRHLTRLLAAAGALLLPLGSAVALAPGAAAAVTPPILVNAGGQAYTDGAGNTWSADRAYGSGGWGHETSYGTGQIDGDIAGTDDDPLYRSYQLFTGWSGYTFDVPNGTYQVTLKMVEDWATGAGQRRFDVRIEGTTVLTGFDIFAACGRLTACDRTFTANVTDGRLNVQFNMNGGANYAAVAAIAVTGGQGGADTTPPSAPGNLRVTGTTASSVSLAWNAATDNVGVTGYDVYRGGTAVDHRHRHHLHRHRPDRRDHLHLHGPRPRRRRQRLGRQRRGQRHHLGRRRRHPPRRPRRAPCGHRLTASSVSPVLERRPPTTWASPATTSTATAHVRSPRSPAPRTPTPA